MRLCCSTAISIVSMATTMKCHAAVSCSTVLLTIRFTTNEKNVKNSTPLPKHWKTEFTVSDSLQEEMLRILLKRFIIQCTRIARHRMNITREKNPVLRLSANTITWSTSITGRRNRCRTMPICCINLPRHYRTSFLPANCLRRFGLSTNGWKRKLNVSCFTATKAPKVADILGFEDQASFSRFFKNMTGQSAVQFRNTQEGKN